MVVFKSPFFLQLYEQTFKGSVMKKVVIIIWCAMVFPFWLNAHLLNNNQLIDVWDFGAEQLNSETYNNQLNVETINGWYSETVEKGSNGNVLPSSFTAGILSWTGGGNDRLRTTNTAITRYDENIASVSGYTGRIYVNSAANTTRYISLDLNEDDEVTLIAKTDAGGIINFVFHDNPDLQTDQVSVTSNLTELRFVAKHAGVYRIFDTQGKPSYYRFYRSAAHYTTLSGQIDVTAADGISENYSLLFENEAGKTWEAVVDDNAYQVTLPVGSQYQLSLIDANGFIINEGSSLFLNEETTTHNISILKVGLSVLSGQIIGLGNSIENLTLVFEPDPDANKIFVPQPVIDVEGSIYSVQLESNCNYTIKAIGVDDFFIEENTVKIDGDAEMSVAFSAKPRYKITIIPEGLNEEQLGKMRLTFTHFVDTEYSYTFGSIDSIYLRDGVYSLAVDGLDDYPLQLGLNSNLVVEGAALNKVLMFEPVRNWAFDDKVISASTTSYKGLVFSGNISNEVAKGHLIAKSGAVIQVPVKPSQLITVAYYYAADFSIEGESYTTQSNSTSVKEYATYLHKADEGYVNIEVGSGVSSTYIYNISVDQYVEYQAEIYVGPNKTYKSINDALSAVAKMKRDNNERVTILIDPGNYEEMLVIDLPNITLKNAAKNPSTDLLNQGVDIDENAVRITSYYGHGYHYYSMAANQKWNADVLRVNKENGFHSTDNYGAGTGNGSYWNATVVITADGFIADEIIFENSFNQYISKKESDDVLVMWETGSKGERPVDFGNVLVQEKSFVERAAAMAITNNTDKVILNKCRVVGRQDSFFGGHNSRVVVYKGTLMGSTDFLFGGMTAVFYRTDLVMNTSDDSNDRSYLTAAQQSGGRGYLMYECQIKSALPEIETASSYLSKPGYFGRPWQANTSEVVFYKTSIDTTNFPGATGQSLIVSQAWLNSLGGESPYMVEYGTIELSGVDNSSKRASWSTVLNEPVLSDGTEITPFNFTKGDDGWDPLPGLIENDPSHNENNSVGFMHKFLHLKVYGCYDTIFFNEVDLPTNIEIFSFDGRLVHRFNIDSTFELPIGQGLWLVKISNVNGEKTIKLSTY